MRFWFFGYNGLLRFLLGATAYLGLIYGALVGLRTSALAQSELPPALYPVGMTMVEFVDPTEGGRPLDYMLIYPATPDRAAKLAPKRPVIRRGQRPCGVEHHGRSQF